MRAPKSFRQGAEETPGLEGREARVFLVGGGTAGSVMPLLAVAEHLVNVKLYFVGTHHGVERKLVPQTIPYLTVSAGKLRRYWAWQNLVDLFKVVIAFFKSLYLVLRYQPNVVVSAGSFVATPMIWAAWCCGIAIVVHQQDLQVSLTTRLTAPFATMLTKAFSEIALHGAEFIGNPVRDLTPVTQSIQIDQTVPTVFIFGGGTGAQALNNLVTVQLCNFTNVIHVTGIGKNQTSFTHPRYHAFELLNEEYKEALAKADIVVARAGLGTISELAVAGKPAIIIPIPNSHQEYNAQFLQQHQAAMVLNQTMLTSEQFTEVVKALLNNTVQQRHFSDRMKHILPLNAAKMFAQKITTLI